MNTCLNPLHDNQRMKYICVDTCCTATKKIGCADCFLEEHITHQRRTTETFKEQVQSQVQQINQVEMLQVSGTPQKDLVKQIDQELEICLDCITQRFSTIKNDLKGQIEQDMQKLQENHDIFAQNLKNELEPINDMSQLECQQLNSTDLGTLIRFYQDGHKIQKHYTKTAEMLLEEKNKVRQKKHKYVSKLRNVMNILLKEFNELMTSKNLQYDDSSEFETPQKNAVSPNKMINLVETARSSRRFPMMSHQKRYMQSKKLE